MIEGWRFGQACPTCKHPIADHGPSGCRLAPDGQMRVMGGDLRYCPCSESSDGGEPEPGKRTDEQWLDRADWIDMEERG